MLSRLREHLGGAGLIVAIVALVAALSGAAIAANGGAGDGKATASAKAKKGPRGPKGAKGDTGAAGPAGPAGAKGDTGAAGANGKDGTNGTNGTNGTSVSSEQFSGEVGPCTEGGSKFTAASGTTYACNGDEGEEGEPWPAGGTLPPGATQTGAWYGTVGAGVGYAPLTFPIPLAAPIDAAHWVVVAKGEAPVNANCDDGVAPPASPAHPEADSGYLCVFPAQGVGTAVAVTKATGGPIDVGADTAGALVTIAGESGDTAYGTFAVTG